MYFLKTNTTNLKQLTNTHSLPVPQTKDRLTAIKKEMKTQRLRTQTVPLVRNWYEEKIFETPNSYHLYSIKDDVQSAQRTSSVHNKAPNISFTLSKFRIFRTFFN